MWVGDDVSIFIDGSRGFKRAGFNIDYVFDALPYFPQVAIIFSEVFAVEVLFAPLDGFNYLVSFEFVVRFYGCSPQRVFSSYDFA